MTQLNIVVVESEDGAGICVMTGDQLMECNRLLAVPIESNEYPEEVNDLLAKTALKPGCRIEGRLEDVVIFLSSFTISTSGDYWGMFDGDGERMGG